MQFYHRQQSKKRLYLCVDENYKDEFYFEVKNKISSQMQFLAKSGVEEIDLQQSHISESCYIKIFLEGYKYPAHIRISSHYGNCGVDILIDNPREVKNMLHFNKSGLYLIKREIEAVEAYLRAKKMF